MGNIWSNQTTQENNERLALDDLDGLVWNISAKITEDAVKNILEQHGVRNNADTLYRKIKNLEAEQTRKRNFFFDKNVCDLYVFHRSMELRYSSVSTFLLCIE